MTTINNSETSNHLLLSLNPSIMLCPTLTTFTLPVKENMTKNTLQTSHLLCNFSTVNVSRQAGLSLNKFEVYVKLALFSCGAPTTEKFKQKQFLKPSDILYI